MSSREHSRVGRRSFVSLLAFFLLAPFAYVWRAMAQNRALSAANREIRIAAPQQDGISFHGPVILKKLGPQIVALSARCPHLGCHIERVAGENLICPCHGSTFSLQGKRLFGPAQADLQRLSIRQEDDGATVVVTTGVVHRGGERGAR